MRQALWLFLLLTLFPRLSTAQQDSYYTIHIGTFIDAKAEEFAPLRSIGFLHANQLEPPLSQVYLGGYHSLEQANTSLEKVRAAGYSAAYIHEQATTAGQQVAIVQIATLPQNQEIDWLHYAKAGQLFALLDPQVIKLAVGIFDNASAARSQLAEIRQQGFTDAFIKLVNRTYLHELTAFETDNVLKKPLIPIQFEDNAPILQPAPTATEQPVAYQTSTSPKTGITTAKEGNNRIVAPDPKSAIELPAISETTKRRSALELQKILKAAGFYSAALDGYYGPGTHTAYQDFINQNYDYQKYLVLAKASPQSAPANEDSFQNTINNLWNNPAGVEGYPNPLAKAYQAYVLFVQLGPDNTVNNLMNAALKEAYLNTPPQMVPGFDYRATYAYNDLTQLILHLYYTHTAPGMNYAIPCWLAERHPEEVSAANAYFTGRSLARQECSDLTEWPEIKILRTIARDLATTPIDPQLNARASANRAGLLVTNQPLSREISDELTFWNNQLWQNASSWANADPLHARIITTLKVAFFQAQVRLEDYFRTKGFQPTEANHLALATLRTLVGNELERWSNN
jgi:peptidoglycan hydrolase-like protein with peptidoglycan-binding domain